MLTIRFARVGKKNRPQFKIMLQEHTIAPGGTHVEVLGSYDPRSKQAVLKEDRIKYWISQGVKVSDTAYNLFLKQGILTGEKRKVKIPAKKVEPAAPEVKADKNATESSVATETKTETAEIPKAEAAAPAAEVKTEKKPKEEEAPKDETKPAEEAPKAEEKKEVITEAPNEEAKPEEKPVEVAPVDKV